MRSWHLLASEQANLEMKGDRITALVYSTITLENTSWLSRTMRNSFKFSRALEISMVKL